MIRFEDIQERVERSQPEADVDLLRRAYVYSAMIHKGQLRRSGEPYLIHPLEVAYILADLDLDIATVATGLLHDTVEDAEDPESTRRQVAERFGDEVGALVEGVTKLKRVEYASEQERQAENLRKMVLAMVDDARVILVKLADRLHNMRTLTHLPEKKRRRIAQETLDIYVPLAHRLGLGRIRAELEELGLRYAEPEIFERLEKAVSARHKVADALIRDVRGRLETILRDQGIKAEIQGRVKSVYSIHRKMQEQGIDADQVYDVVAFRVLVDSLKDCYGALGIVHQHWRPVPGRFKDYVAMPKPNLYQSLHTTVMAEGGIPFEVQIRTHEMHRIAESGIAAHWTYKESGTSGSPSDEEVAGVQWLRQLVEWQKDVQDSREFVKYMKIDLFPEQVHVFTPRGKVLTFPRDSTPIDFAYAIHTEVGHECVGARVNGKLVPLRTRLQNGDIVEIVTQTGHKPNRDWLSIVRTGRARTKIRTYLKTVERERSTELGRSMLEKELKKYRKTLKTIGDDAWSAALPKLRVNTREEMLAAIGHGRITAARAAASLLPDREPAEAQAESILTRVTRALRRERDAVVVRGVEDTLVTLAGCCNPIPGDQIVGYITRGRGVSVHTEECPNLTQLLIEPDRRIEVAWSRPEGEDRFRVGLRVVSENRPGRLARVAQILEQEKINIRHADAGVDEAGQGIISVVAEVESRQQVEKLMDRIRRIEGVSTVERVSPTSFAGPAR